MKSNDDEKRDVLVRNYEMLKREYQQATSGRLDFVKNKLSSREQLIFEILLVRGSSSVDEIIDYISVSEKKVSTRRSVTGSIKYLAAKIPEHGFFIRRTSKIGTGAIGVYEMVSNS